MKLKLGIVMSCDPDGCIVSSIGDGEEFSAKFSPLVKGRIKISKNQLVALDLARSPKELVWRWIAAKVDRLENDTVVLDDGRCQLLQATNPPELNLHLEAGDEVWACKTEEGAEVHARTEDLDHAHEERLVRYVRPMIEKQYATE